MGETSVVAPLACLAVGAFVVYLIARLTGARNEALATLTALFFAVALWFLVRLGMAIRVQAKADAFAFGKLPTWGWFGSGGAFLRADLGGVIVASAALGLGTLVAIYSGRYLALDKRYETYYPLLLLLGTGLTGMVMAADLFNLYMFCELMGVTSYVLVSFRRRTDTAIEAGFKYLVMGSVGTITLLMGISFVYRETGDLGLPIQAIAIPGRWGRVGLACILAGLGIKSALVPLHTWLPDAHGRAPSGISAMLSGIVIQSTLYVLLTTTLSLGFPARSLGTLLVLLSFPGMLIGNVLGLVQVNGKRLLAYSSVAHMGYLLLVFGLGLRQGIPEAVQAGFFLLLVHAAMKGLAFLCKGACHFYCDATTIAQLRGTYQRLPLVAIAFGIAIANLTGIPPLAGFVAKWLVLRSSLLALDGLAILAGALFLVNSLLSLGYYLPLITTLFMPVDRRSGTPIRVSRWMSVPIVLIAGLLIAMGLLPGQWLEWVGSAGSHMLALGG